MGLLSPILRNAADDTLIFWCPGCNCSHAIKHGEGGWSWNGDVNKPTFGPSVLVRSGHYASHYVQGEECWCTYNAQHPEEASDTFECVVCHSFIVDGEFQYLQDCTHKLVGLTVTVPPWPAPHDSNVQPSD